MVCRRLQPTDSVVKDEYPSLVPLPGRWRSLAQPDEAPVSRRNSAGAGQDRHVVGVFFPDVPTCTGPRCPVTAARSHTTLRPSSSTGDQAHIHRDPREWNPLLPRAKTPLSPGHPQGSVGSEMSSPHSPSAPALPITRASLSLGEDCRPHRTSPDDYCSAHDPRTRPRAPASFALRTIGRLEQARVGGGPRRGSVSDGYPRASTPAPVSPPGLTQHLETRC